MPASLGFGTLIVRDVAIYHSQQEWGSLRGLLRYADRTVLLLSVILAVFLSGIAELLFAGSDKENMQYTLWLASALVPLFALLNLRESSLRGLEHVFRARIPGMIFRPGILLLGMTVLYVYSPFTLSAPSAMMINVFAAAAALTVSTFWLRKSCPPEVKHARTVREPIKWLKTALPMLIYSGSQIIVGQIDIAMLGSIRGAGDAGVYTASNRLAYLLIYINVAAEVILAPIMARLYAGEEKKRLQKLLIRAARIAFFVMLPIGLAMILGGHWFLAIFGSGFLVAKGALAILAFGRLIDVATGSGALLLGMTGYERTVAVVLSGSALGNILLNAIFIPRYGMNGAAVVSVITLILAKLLLSAYALNRTGLHVTIFGAWSGIDFVKRRV